MHHLSVNVCADELMCLSIFVQKNLTSSIGIMESIKSDVNVANGQCDYPFEANIETTG